MTDALFNVGNRLSAEDWLRLSSAVDGVRNEKNALLRGVSAIIPGVSVSQIPDSGFSTNLRRYSTANDEEILGNIIYNMADGDYKTEKEYVREYKRRNYPSLFMEKALAEWRRTKGREESAATAAHARKMEPGAYTSQQQTIAKEKARIKAEKLDDAMIATIKRASEDDIQAIRDGKKYHAVVRDRLTKESAGWEPNHQEYYKSLMAMADQKPKAIETTKAVHNKRTGDDLWMTETQIAAANKADPGSIVPLSDKELDPEQVNFTASGSAAQILGDPAILTEVGLDYDTAAALLEEWSKDKSWLVRFTEIAPEHRKLYTKWRDTATEIARWWLTPPKDSSKKVEGKVID